MHKKGAKTKSYVHNTQQKYDDSQTMVKLL